MGWLEGFITDQATEILNKTEGNLVREFSFVQTLQASSFLMGKTHLVKNEAIINFVDSFSKLLEIETTERHIKLLPSTLWSIMILGRLENN